MWLFCFVYIASIVENNVMIICCRNFIFINIPVWKFFRPLEYFYNSGMHFAYSYLYFLVVCSNFVEHFPACHGL